jgi:hypothetical protein
MCTHFFIYTYLYALRVNLQLNDKSRNTDVSRFEHTKTFNNAGHLDINDLVPYKVSEPQ